MATDSCDAVGCCSTITAWVRHQTLLEIRLLHAAPIVARLAVVGPLGATVISSGIRVWYSWAAVLEMRPA